MTTPLDIVNGALRSIGALASGETADAMQANDAFNTLNDMLAQWSNERLMVYYTTEVVFPITGGTYQYTIGDRGTVKAVFVGSQSLRALTVTSVTSGAIALNQTLSIGGKILQFATGAGGQGATAAGLYVSDSSITIGSTSITAYYERPVMVNAGFTRVGGIDYPLQVISEDDYKLIGLKTLSGPWPSVVYYQPTEPLGNLFFWPSPTSGEVHLFCSTILGSFSTLADVIQLPQGYNLALRYCLADLLLPEYGINDPQMVAMISDRAAKAKANIKRTNMRPQGLMHVDPVLMNGRPNDAGWIMTGGF